nr:RNA-directed DNA polymerase, eukaryota, reverse transcriptase zinc-binding domain protein [Tanacetum cinerariifolium]
KRKLLSITKREALDCMQKSKVKWAVEGDENSKFFHDQRLLMSDLKRDLVSELGMIDKDIDRGVVSEASILRRLDLKRKLLTIQYQADDLERRVSRDEIRLDVWNCGDNKSPGPDGYTFEFFKKYWECIGPDFCEAVEYFFVSGSFSKGCNSSFVALIPKVIDAKVVNDFRPISLIVCVYKVITKVLANKLVSVILDLVSDTQSAFVSGRQILDGPFILDEILNWCKRKKKQVIHSFIHI